jgi:putative membrane protein
MYVFRDIRWSVVFRFAWAYLIFYFFWGMLVYYGHAFAKTEGIDLAFPFLPISTIGIAVSFLLGFKNSQAYDRFWEARKIWGGIVNYSRTWTNQVLHFVGDTFRPDADPELLADTRRLLVYRHLAWVNALRLTLRRPSSFSPRRSRSAAVFQQGSPDLETWVNEVGGFLAVGDLDDVMEAPNVPTELVRLQGEDLARLRKENLIDDFRHMELMRVLEECYNLQGKCERIKNTPFPRQYAFFSKIFTWIFVLLLPWGLLGEFDRLGQSFVWLLVPVNMLISWIFMTMELVGDNSEDPFEGFVNDVPMSALCRTIEIDLRAMLDETDLPERLAPVDGILM